MLQQANTRYARLQNILPNFILFYIKTVYFSQVTGDRGVYPPDFDLPYLTLPFKQKSFKGCTIYFKGHNNLTGRIIALQGNENTFFHKLT
jgi:hypothetical protein